MAEKQEIKVRMSKVNQPREIVLMQHIDKTFKFPLWVPLCGLLLGLLGEIFFFINGRKK